MKIRKTDYQFRYYFHYINDNGVTYMGMCNNKYPREAAFKFLEDVMAEFKKKYSPRQIQDAISFSFNDEFKVVLKDRMNYYNKHLDSRDNISTLRQGLVSYKDNVLQANELLMERGEKMNLIVRKADSLKSESTAYYSSVS